MAADDDRFGPVDYLVVQFPQGEVGRDGFARLLGLVDAGTIRVLDLEFVTNDAGTVRTVPAAALDIDLADLDGANSGLLDAADLDVVAAEVAPGSVAAVLVYEELSLLPVLRAWEAVGATVVADGPVTVDDLDAALSTTEPVG